MGFLIVLRFHKDDDPRSRRRLPQAFRVGSLEVETEYRGHAEIPPEAPSNPKSRIIDLSLISPTIVVAGFATLTMAIAFSVITTLENQINSRIGRKPLIVTGLLLMAPVTVGLSFAGSTLALVDLQLLQGLGAASIAAPALGYC